MTNREESDAAEHETFPGPGPLRADEAKRGIHPVEQMVDAAIDRIARESGAARDSEPSQPSPREAAAPADAGHALALTAPDRPSTLATAASVRRTRGRLRWKGLDVSEEFRSYADRVARGEDLPPFQGKILAEPDPAFPWDPAARTRAQSRALQQQFGLWTGVALFLGLSVWVLVVQVGRQTETSSRAAESPLATVVLGNHPSPEAPRLDAPAAPEAAPAEVVAAEELTELGTPLAAQATTALASLHERPSAAAPAAPATASAARAATASSGTSAASPSANSRAAAPAPSSSSVGVFVATRPASGELAPSEGAGASVRTASAPSIAAAGVAAASVAAAASPHALGAGVNGGSTAPSAPVSAPAASPTDPAASPAAHADPKKEPGREASAMGPLLVENPSF